MGGGRHRPDRAARAAAALPGARPAHRRLSLRVHVARALRRGRRRRHRQRPEPRAARPHRGQPRRGRGRHRRAERHDGRPGRRDPRGARRPRPRDDADPRLLGEVRLRVLRPVPRGGRQCARVRRPARLPDGSGQRPRGHARVQDRSRRGRRRDHDQAGAAVPRRDPRGARGVPGAARGVQRLRRVRDGQGGRARRLARRARRRRSSR